MNRSRLFQDIFAGKADFAGLIPSPGKKINFEAKTMQKPDIEPNNEPGFASVRRFHQN